MAKIRRFSEWAKRFQRILQSRFFFIPLQKKEWSIRTYTLQRNCRRLSSKWDFCLCWIAASMDWPMWKWKGQIVTEGNCVYGKFFAGKAGYISREWWPDFFNYRRSKHPVPEEGSIEDTILLTLREQGSLITRQLRAACGFTGPKDFVYPTDKHGKEYGWGWSLLNTPEQLLGREACRCERTPEASYDRMAKHLRTILPEANDTQIAKLLK